MSSTSRQVDDFTNRINKALRGFERTDRKKILRAAARPFVLAARSTDAFDDQTGNLRRSLDRIPGLRKSPSQFVGPRRGKRAKGVADGYYPAAIFRKRPGGAGKGGGRVFNRLVLKPAYESGKRAAEQIIITQAQRAIVQQGKKQNVA